MGSTSCLAVDTTMAGCTNPLWYQGSISKQCLNYGSSQLTSQPTSTCIEIVVHVSTALGLARTMDTPDALAGHLQLDIEVIYGI